MQSYDFATGLFSVATAQALVLTLWKTPNSKPFQLSTCRSVYFQTVLETWIADLCIAVNIILPFTAIVGNLLILVALITQPCFVVYLILVARENDLDTCVLFTRFLNVSSALLCGISLCTLTIISVDRLLALLLDLRYRHVVTVARVRGITFLSYFVLSSHTLVYFINTRIFFPGMISIILLFLVVSTFCYLKIYFTLRRRQAQVQQEIAPGQFNGPNRVRQLKYKRSVSTSVLVSIFMIACYLPFTIFAVVIAIRKEVSSSLLAAESIAISLVYFNSSINPVIYCWRIREVRQAVKATIRWFVSFAPR